MLLSRRYNQVCGAAPGVAIRDTQETLDSSDVWPTAQELRERYVIEAWLRWGRESQVARVLGMDYRTVNLILRKANLVPLSSDERPETPQPLMVSHESS